MNLLISFAALVFSQYVLGDLRIKELDEDAGLPDDTGESEVNVGVPSLAMVSANPELCSPEYRITITADILNWLHLYQPESGPCSSMVGSISQCTQSCRRFPIGINRVRTVQTKRVHLSGYKQTNKTKRVQPWQSSRSYKTFCDSFSRWTITNSENHTNAEPTLDIAELFNGLTINRQHPFLKQIVDRCGCPISAGTDRITNPTTNCDVILEGFRMQPKSHRPTSLGFRKNRGPKLLTGSESRYTDDPTGRQMASSLVVQPPGRSRLGG
jgi:hypothetical protein